MLIFRASLSLACALALAACSSPGPYAQTRWVLPAARERTPVVPLDANAQQMLLGRFVLFDDFETEKHVWSADAGALSWRRAPAGRTNEHGMHFGAADGRPFASAAEARALWLDGPIDLWQVQRPVLTFVVSGLADPPEALTLDVEARTEKGEWRALAARLPAGPLPSRRYVIEMAEYAEQPLELRWRARAEKLARPTTGLVLDDVTVVDAARVRP